MTGWAGVYIDIAVVLIIGLMIPILSYVIGAALKRADYPEKRKRFESGNDQEGRGRGMFLMQYYPYALIFMAAEPAFVILFAFLTLFNFISYEIFIIGSVIFLPALFFSSRTAREIKKWMMHRD